MTESETPQTHRGLPEIWESVADRASAGALATCGAIGLAAMVTLMAARPDEWAPVMPSLAVGAFGAWGIAHREQRSSLHQPRRRALLGAAKGASGIVATAALLFAAFRATMWIIGGSHPGW